MRKWYVGLLAVCLLSLVLSVVGVVLILASPSNTAETSVVVIATLLLANIVAFVGWAWGIVLAAKNRHWVWMVLNILFSILSAGIYSVVRLQTSEKRADQSG